MTTYGGYTTNQPAPDLPRPEKVNPLRKGTLWLIRAVSYLVYAYVLVVEIILLLGFLLLLGGANPSSGFVEWVYRSLDRVMRPFRGIFSSIDLGTTGNEVQSVFDTSVLFAMIVYAIVAIALSALLDWLNERMERIHRADAAYERQQVVNQQITAAQAAADAAAAAAAPPTAPSPSTATNIPPAPPAAPPPPQP